MDEAVVIAPAAAWSGLPASVLLRVFTHLSLTDLCHAGVACWHWHSVLGSDSLWSNLLQQLHGRSTPVAGSSCCRHSLMQLRTSSLWSAGTPCTINRNSSSSSSSSSDVRTGLLPVKATELTCLWASTASTSADGSTCPAVASLPAINRHLQLPRCSSLVAAAAGRSHLVLLNCKGGIIDTRGAPGTTSTAAQGQSAVQQQQAGADLHLLQPRMGVEHPAVAAAAGAAAAGQLELMNPWQPACGAVVVAIATGLSHVLAVSSCGRVWGWGSNAAGELGLGGCWPWQGAPTEVTAVLDGAWKVEGDAVTAAACGSSHSVLLTASGAVYTAGCNTLGQCGQGPDLQECPVFCQPHLLDTAVPAAAPPNGGSTNNVSTTLDPASLPPLPAAAAIAAGVTNTLVATWTGRVLVCGASGSGQCGLRKVKAGVCAGFVDVGPEIGWHGLTRPSQAEVEAAGGSVAAALPKVVQVAAGDGTCYALTEGGEIFAWGQGSKGQLGTGGCPKLQASPAKLSWARQIRQISCSLTGQFAGAVDRSGRLYTWGAGKWGQLGHGDTSKRTVGRAVKQLKHLDVLQVSCGPENILVLTCQRAPHHHLAQHNLPQSQQQQLQQQQQHPDEPTSPLSPRQQQHQQLQQGRRKGGSSRGPAGAAAISSAVGTNQRDLSPERASALHLEPSDMSMQGVDWQDIEGEGPFYCPPPRAGSSTSSISQVFSQPWEQGNRSPGGSRSSSKQLHRRRRQPTLQDLEADCLPEPPGCSSKSRYRATTGADGSPRLAAAADAAAGRARSGSSADQEGDLITPDILDAAAVAAASDDHASRGGTCGGRLHRSESKSSQGSSVEGSSSTSSFTGRHPRMDKGFKRLLRRLLTGFMADQRQREMTFPASLSAADRYHVHVAADAWGLGHSSHNEGADRVIKVWKVCRTRKMVASTGDAGYGSD